MNPMWHIYNLYHSNLLETNKCPFKTIESQIVSITISTTEANSYRYSHVKAFNGHYRLDRQKDSKCIYE